MPMAVVAVRPVPNEGEVGNSSGRDVMLPEKGRERSGCMVVVVSSATLRVVEERAEVGSSERLRLTISVGDEPEVGMVSGHV